jgi:hypothetical protein
VKVTAAEAVVVGGGHAGLLAVPARDVLIHTRAGGMTGSASPASRP